MQRGGNKGKEAACEGATDEPERYSCSLDDALAIALYPLLATTTQQQYHFAQYSSYRLYRPIMGLYLGH